MDNDDGAGREPISPDEIARRLELLRLWRSTHDPAEIMRKVPEFRVHATQFLRVAGLEGPSYSRAIALEQASRFLNAAINGLNFAPNWEEIPALAPLKAPVWDFIAAFQQILAKWGWRAGWARFIEEGTARPEFRPPPFPPFADIDENLDAPADLVAAMQAALDALVELIEPPAGAWLVGTRRQFNIAFGVSDSYPDYLERCHERGELRLERPGKRLFRVLIFDATLREQVAERLAKLQGRGSRNV